MADEAQTAPAHNKEPARNVRLRDAEPTDEPLLLRLHRGARAAELAHLPLSGAQLEAFLKMQYEAQRRAYAAQHPQAAHSIILLDDQPVGRLMVDRAGEAFTLVDITLLPEFRGQGIGGALIQELLGEAASNGKPVALYVYHSNPARRLYERLGFTTIEESETYWLMRWQSGRETEE
jgi:ribosomal protein S18 acetylase RimI-like enzyme